VSWAHKSAASDVHGAALTVAACVEKLEVLSKYQGIDKMSGGGGRIMAQKMAVFKVTACVERISQN